MVKAHASLSSTDRQIPSRPRRARRAEAGQGRPGDRRRRRPRASFLGYVGKGLADAVAIGNIFSSPPPDPILQCAEAASGGEGVLFVYGNYAGDVMNFEMAAEMAEDEGIEVRTVLTTDDIASSPIEDRDGRRGVAGNFFIFKVGRRRLRPWLSARRLRGR